MNKVVRMCLIHDLGETFTGDNPQLRKPTKTSRPGTPSSSPGPTPSPPQRQEWLSLLDEMEKLQTKEARTSKALDRLEALISHNRSDLSTWLPWNTTSS